MLRTLSNIGEDFRVYSEACPGRINSIVSPFLMLGLYVSFSYRVRFALYKVPVVGVLISRILGLLTNVLTGCYISPKAKIEGGLYLPHPIGVVVGDKVVVGRRARIYQGVTLGSKATGDKAYPILADRITVFPNSVIVGSITLGSHVTVGAGSIVLRSAPDGAVLVGNPAKLIKIRGIDLQDFGTANQT